MTGNSGFTRRRFLSTAAAAAGAAALPSGMIAAQGKAQYTRHNVMSDAGKKALASYAKAVGIMLKLPADDPHNWFRNAFVHFMDCPHGNWWFYVWHRGFLGYFEQTIRVISGDPAFAIPYWDWTTLPQIPDSLFDGVLTPRDSAYEPYTGNLAVFKDFIRPALNVHWDRLNQAQHKQLEARNYKTFEALWNDVTANGNIGDYAFAPTCTARYLTRNNPMLDSNTKENVSPRIVLSALLPIEFNNPEPALAFTSARTPSHNTQPTGSGQFSTMEGLPHNKVHNYIGGAGPLNPGPFGNMTNNLSPVDPIFFLHHSNMDRLWDIWTRKQKALGFDYGPSKADAKTFNEEPFLFFVNAKGDSVDSNSTAGDYMNMERWEYDYEPGFGEAAIKPPRGLMSRKHFLPHRGLLRANGVSAVSVPAAEIKSHLEADTGVTLFVEITLATPASSARDFDVYVGAPADAKLTPGSPYFAGTISFLHLGHTHGAAHDAKFAVPLPKSQAAFGDAKAAVSSLNVRVIPSYGTSGKVDVKAVSIRGL